MRDKTKVPLVKTNIGRVLALRKKLTKNPKLYSLIGCKATADDINNFVDILHPQLPEGILRGILTGSCACLTLSVVKKDDIDQLLWRIAGNIKALTLGKLVHPWELQKKLEWMPVQIIKMRLIKSDKRTDAEYHCKILAGSGAGLVSKRILSKKMCNYLSRILGFNRTNLKFKRFEDLVGMRFYGLFDPALDIYEPRFWEMNCTASLQQYNKRLIKIRARIDFKCPANYRHACSVCPVGYDRCIAGTHPNTYTLLDCKVCKNKSWFDFDISKDMCIVCFGNK